MVFRAVKEVTQTQSDALRRMIYQQRKHKSIEQNGCNKFISVLILYSTRSFNSLYAYSYFIF